MNEVIVSLLGAAITVLLHLFIGFIIVIWLVAKVGGTGLRTWNTLKRVWRIIR